MKRILTAILAATVLFLLCSCGNEEQPVYPMTINSTPIDSEIFTYFLDEAAHTTPQKTKEEIIYNATQLCIQYVSVNSTFAREGLVLDPAELTELSRKANEEWNLFGNYYESVGVSKQTFIKIHLSEEYTEKLRRFYFGEGGVNEVSESTLKEYLAEHFVSFRVITVPKKKLDENGNEIDRTPEMEKALNEKLTAGLNAINVTHTSIESVYATFVSDRSGDREEYAEIVTDGSDHDYPPEFVNAVRAMSINTAVIFDFDGSLYLVYREEISSDKDIYEQYKNECLEALTNADLQTAIEEIGKGYSSVKNQYTVNTLYTAYMNAAAKFDKNIK